MRHRLQRHPFAVRAHFRSVLVLAYAFSPKLLEPLLPPGLVLDTYTPKGEAGSAKSGASFGFLAIALVQTEALRPTFLPRWLGQDFFLSGYRIFSRFTDPTGRTRRGLRILRSDTDRSRMRWAGNLLTHYQYRKARVELRETPTELAIDIDTGGEADLEVVAELGREDTPLPTGSPFETLRDARAFAGPLPFTFDYEEQTHSIVMIEGVRKEWTPRLVPVEVRKATFFEQPAFDGAEPILASAFHLSDIDYRWECGIRVPLPAD